jgi:adenylate kinase
MRVGVTGTPGTGKTTAVEYLAESNEFDSELDIVHLNDVIKDKGLTTGYDDDRDSAIADFDAVSEWLNGREDILFESHLAHHFKADSVVVCRCHPDELEQRLREREEGKNSITENAESEALDVVLSEAVDQHGMDSIYEIETTDRSPGAVADEIGAVIAGERDPSAGTVSYVEYL